ncbi:MAG: TRAP transporter substrate-binding protein DctP [Pseudomonadota bacterium]
MKKLLAAALTSIGLLTGTQSYAADIELTLAHSWPKGFPIFGTSVDDYAAMVSEMSDGRIEIKVDSRNKHKSAFGIFDFVKTGQYDIGQSASYYYGGKEPDALFFTTMPFGMTALEQYAWFHEGGGLELANQVFEKHDIEVMTGGNTTMQMGGWFRKEINSIEDLKGLKMRIPGFGGKVLAGVGAVPTNIPAGELFQALERGTIDALEWVGPSLDLRMGFHKVAPFYYTGWHEPSTELMYFFNKSTMESLPAWARSTLLNAAKLTGFNMTVQSQHESAQNWATMKNEFPNIVVKNFPEDVISALRQSNAALIEKEKSRSALAAQIIQSQSDYLATVRRWTEIGDWSYLANVANNK